MKHKGLYQLLCAAVVDSQFRETLLRDPPRAISGGYLDYRFSLTPEEWVLVTNIEARELEDFATQINRWVSTNDSGNGCDGNGHGILTTIEDLAKLFYGC